MTLWNTLRHTHSRAIFLIITISLVVSAALWVTRPKAEKKAAQTQAVLVEILTAKLQKKRISVTAYGSIQADKTVSLAPQVSGRVIKLSDNFTLGGLVGKGEVLLKIDPTDFELAIQQAEASVVRAEFDLQVEEGRQVVAKREWELLDPSIKPTELGEELALRKPHLKDKQAALTSARSTLEKAKLDLERTELIAPFEAVVLEKVAEVGQLVSPQTSVAKLVGTGAFRVRVSIPYDWLKWITIPQKEGELGSLAVIKRKVDGEATIPRFGHVTHLLGDLDPNGRMARVLVRVSDPLGLKNKDLRDAPLLLDTYVRVELQGPLLEQVFVLPRRCVREGEKIWVMNEDDRLEVREIHVLLGKEQEVIVDRGLHEGDRIVISPLPNALPGMLLKELELQGSDNGLSS